MKRRSFCSLTGASIGAVAAGPSLTAQAAAVQAEPFKAKFAPRQIGVSQKILTNRKVCSRLLDREA